MPAGILKDCDSFVLAVRAQQETAVPPEKTELAIPRTAQLQAAVDQRPKVRQLPEPAPGKIRKT